MEALPESLRIPEATANACLPPEDLPVLKLIKFNLPPLHKSTVFLNPTNYLSEYAPTHTAFDPEAIPVPSHAVVGRILVPHQQQGPGYPWRKTQLLNPRSAEYAISGRPVAWEAAIEIHRCLDECWEVQTSLPPLSFTHHLSTKVYSSTQDDVVKKKASNGSNSSMYLSARRSVFIPNAFTMDALRVRQRIGLLLRLDDPDLRYNRVPEVLIYNSVSKKYLPMSFHELYRLGPGLVVNVTVTPMVSRP
ncbi:hypothetical protein DFH08DRAFT_814985 [Mycena albidolilacea]|uniref:Uncharacterized protein n=1 Tax=Mycena albidolilacea TaxID=1033008 RepID=A0AAD6ZNJ3_9AGAR|nr:hypothetical protein DFH08DRAFT_814985 [Mycena albidolilacea]